MKKMKKFKTLKYFFIALGYVLSYAPALALIINGFAKGEPGEQFALGSCCMFAIVMAVIQFRNKTRLRSIIWVLLLGAYICLNKVAGYIAAIAICTLIDEVIVGPISKYYTKKYDQVVQAKEVFDYGSSENKPRT